MQYSHDPKSHATRPEKKSRLKEDHKTSIPSTQSTKKKEVPRDQDIEDQIAQMSKLSVDNSKYAKLFYHAIKLDRDIIQIFLKPVLGNFMRSKVESNSFHTYRDKPSNSTYL